MAQQGSLTPSGWDVNVDGTMFGQSFVFPNAFTINYIEVVLDETTSSNAHIVGAGLYRISDGVLISTSATRNDILTGGYATYSFSTWSGGSIPAGTYAPCVLADQGGGNLNMRGSFDAGTSVSQGSLFTGGVLPNPATLFADNFTVAMVIDYTEGGGGPTGIFVPGNAQRNRRTSGRFL